MKERSCDSCANSDKPWTMEPCYSCYGCSNYAPMGEWEELPPACNGSMLVRCTNCRRVMSDRDIGLVRHFCPNCGAKMKESAASTEFKPGHNRYGDSEHYDDYAPTIIPAEEVEE